MPPNSTGLWPGPMIWKTCAHKEDGCAPHFVPQRAGDGAREGLTLITAWYTVRSHVADGMALQPAFAAFLSIDHASRCQPTS